MVRSLPQLARQNALAVVRLGAGLLGGLAFVRAAVPPSLARDESAFVPSNGETVWSHVGREARTKIELGQDWLVTGPVREYDSLAEAEGMGARRTTHPQGCFTEPVFLAQPLESFPFTRTYIKATQAPANDIGNEAFWRAARHAEGSPAWRYQEIATNHMVANNRAEELARILADIR
jgi:hypothetical protein